ncbi:MAG TPA: phosphoglucosamine mutase [Firmicutes bacterium]|nr:phosphoglucosamine mutase [Bacillota bacterium]
MGRLFGTDGVRGVANRDLTPELAMKIGRATACVLTDSGKQPRILIGRDTRASGDMLQAALTAGLCSVGADVVLLGVVPTPAVAYLVGKLHADAGVMISASHNPCEFNGIKIFSGEGYKLPDALEEEIENLVFDEEKLPEAPISGGVGQVKERYDAIDLYVDHLERSAPNRLDGLHIAIDCANGSASRTAQRVFTDLGADCHMMACEPNGVNINDECGSTHMETLMEFVVKNKLDAGIAFDGDADRCLAVDENGQMVDGDFMMAICALDMKSRGVLRHDTVVGTVMTNMGFVRFCQDNGLNFVATKVGDRYVLEEMLLKGYSFGGEQSGHYIFREFATTGDGQLSAVQFLSILSRRHARLSSLITVMERYPQVLINVRVSNEGKRRFYTDADVRAAVQRAEALLGEDGRLLVRPSGTEPLLRVMTEGRDHGLITRVANDVADVLRDRLA